MLKSTLVVSVVTTSFTIISVATPSDSETVYDVGLNRKVVITEGGGIAVGVGKRRKITFLPVDNCSKSVASHVAVAV